MWVALFAPRKSDIFIKALFTEVITKYARMSTGQFRKQFLRETKVIKKTAHREQIKMLEMATVLSKAAGSKWLYDSIMRDTTKNKKATHRILQPEIETDPSSLISNIKKTELQL